MTRSSLKTFSLSSFRGASKPFRLEFDKNKKLTLIYGENGTGKTTICDGFQFLAEGRVGSLEDKGLGGQLDKFWLSVGAQNRNICVELETASGVCKGSVHGKNISVEPDNLRPQVAILRRNQILKIVEAPPAERYKEIKRFIDIDTVETSESKLKACVDSLKNRQKNAEVALVENDKALEQFYETAGKPPADSALVWARARLGEPQHHLDANIGAIGKLRLAFQDMESYPTQYQEILSKLNSAKANLDAKIKAANTAAAQAGGGASELLGMFQASAKFLHDHPSTETCPLCDSKEKISGLANRVQEKLQSFAALEAANEAQEESCQNYAGWQQRRDNVVRDFRQKCEAFNAAKAGHAWPEACRIPTTLPPEDVESLGGWLTANKELPPTWQALEETWQGDKRSLEDLKKAVGQYEENFNAQKQMEWQIPRVEKALKIVIEERQAFTDEIIRDIADNVGTLYEAIHPGEGLNKITIQLDPNKRASLDLHSEFCTQKAPPQAYFSQSHLDTLGLCVFIALALRTRPDETILGLDDVVGSLDEPHVERVIEMIYEQSQRFRHCIVTTHYRPWREKYRWGWLKNGQCQFIELARWDLEKGLGTTRSFPEIQRLKKLLEEEDAPDLQSICSKAGVILEAALDYLTQKYECAVPRRNSHTYTLGDLLPAINTKLRNALKAEIRDDSDDVKMVDLGPILTEIECIVQTRNVIGAHFNAISFELLDSDSLNFAQTVVRLMDALTHPDDGWPNSKKSGSYWATSNDSRRLYPLVKPA